MSHNCRVLLDEALRGMLLQDVVEPACSHSSPLLLLPKKQSDWLIVVDFRKLNATTIPDRYPMLRLGNLQSLGDSNAVFSILDLHSGFFQVELEESSWPYTAFTICSGQFKFKRMTQGICNSPLKFQKLMKSLLLGLIGTSVFCILDDVIIAS